MRKALFLILLLLCGKAHADEEVYSHWLSTFDKVTSDSLCSDGQIFKKVAGVWTCSADDSTAGGGTIRVSEDGTFVVSADTIDFRTGLKATATGTKVLVSGDMATTTAPGIASFDSTNFSVGPFGGVSIKSDGVSATELNASGVESELEGVLDLQDLQGAVTDGQVPNNITIDLATAATALAANGANCSAGSYPLGVDELGAVESCTVAGSGSGTILVSEDGTTVTSADTVNFTTGLKASSSVSGKAIVSGDMATTTTPGIASFDSTYFTVGPFGGVTLTTAPGDITSVGNVAAGAAFAGVSGDTLIFNDAGAAGDAYFRLNTDANPILNPTRTDVGAFKHDFHIGDSTGSHLVFAPDQGWIRGYGEANENSFAQFQSYGTDSSIVLQGANGTYDTPTISVAQDAVGYVNFDAYDGTVFRQIAYIEGSVDGTMADTDAPGRIGIYTTTDGGITATERLRIDNAGFVSARNGGISSGVLGIMEDSDAGSNFASFQVPALTANTVYTLPSDDGDSGEQLQTNGSGTLSWEASGSGTPVFPMISEDGTGIASADTVNYTTGIKATASGTKVTVSGDIATTTTPGIASFDTNTFSVGAFGGVTVVLSADAVMVGTVTGTDRPALPSCSNATTSKLLYDNATNAFSCGSDQDSGGATAWNDIGDAASDGSIAFGGTTQTITGNTNDVTAIGQDMLHLTYTNDAATDVLSQKGIVIENAASANGMEALIYLTNSDTDDVVTSGIIMDSAAGLITTALDVSDAEIGTALSFGANDILGTTGLINLTNFDVGADGDLDRIKNIPYSWPSDDGDSGEQLQTDGSGNLTWEAAGSGGGGGSFPMVSEDGTSVVSANTVNYSGINVANSSGVVTVSPKFEFIGRVESAKLPLINPAQIDAGKPLWKLLFDATTPERASFDTVIPRWYSGGSLSMDVVYTMASATANSMVFGMNVMCVTPGDAVSLDNNSFDSYVSGAQTVPGTAGLMAQMGVSITSTDSLAAGDLCRFMVSRDTNAASDTATGDLEIRKLRIYEI